MPHSINDSGKIVVNLEDYSFLPSIRLREKINYLCKDLPSLDKIEHFSMCMIFNDFAVFSISNMYLWTIPYNTLGYKRADQDLSYNVYHGKEYFIERNLQKDEIQKVIIDVLESRYKIFSTFALVRECWECTFIFEAYHKYQVAFPEKIYHKSKTKFENFCIFFFEQILSDIKLILPEKNHLRIFNDKQYFHNVIKNKNKINPPPILTERELDCLYWVRHGKTAEETAVILSISYETVQTHLKNIRRKMNCASITQAVSDAIHYNILI